MDLQPKECKRKKKTKKQSKQLCGILYTVTILMAEFTIFVRYFTECFSLSEILLLCETAYGV